MNESIKIRVYFSESRSDFRILNMRRWKRLTYKRLIIQYDYFLCWVIRKLGNSYRAHVSVGFNEAVIDPQIGGNFWWPELKFVEEYPRLLEYVELNAKTNPSKDLIFERGRRYVMPTLLRFLSRGRTKSDDCLTVAIKVLSQSGIDVCKKTYTVQSLYDQLIQIDGAKVVKFQDYQPISKPKCNKQRIG